MTWNLWGEHGDLPRRRTAILRVLTEVAPDVCGLQEVAGDPGRNLAEELATDLGLSFAFAPRSGPDADERLGNAVLSRWPITMSSSARLEGCRTVCHTVVAAPGGPLPVFTTHLTYGLELSALRVAQVRDLARIVAEGSAGCPYPPIVTGDLNAEPESDEVRLLAGLLTAPAVPGLVLLDTWRFATPGDPGHTWTRRNPYLARTGLPDCRIDYVLVGAGGDRGLRVLHARLAGEEPVDGVQPSDHLAVVADVDGIPDERPVLP